MYCYKCGKELSDTDKFCPDCGALQAPAVQQNQHDQIPENQQIQYERLQEVTSNDDFWKTPPPYMRQEAKKSRKRLWIILTSVTALIMTGITVYFIFFSSIGSLALVGRAINNLGSEAERRINHTPFKVLTMLGEVLEEGTVTSNFTHSAALFGGFLTSETDGTIKLSSDLQARNFALEANVEVFGQKIELDAYMNRERLALRVPILDNNFYGIRYSTFRNDIRSLGKLLMLDNETMDDWADHVDMLNTVINSETVIYDDSSIYAKPISRFIKDLEISNRRTSIRSDGESVNCRLIVIRISKESILSFLNEMYDVYEENESTQTMVLQIARNPLFQNTFGRYGGDHEQFLRDLRDQISDFEKYYSGDIVLSFYIARGDRLLSAELNADIVYNYDPTELRLVFDFGSSIEDDWTLDIDFDNSYKIENYSVSWAFDKQTNSQVNAITSSYTNIVTIVTDSNNSTTLISEWNPDIGVFALTHMQMHETSSITGLFKTDYRNFYLLIDDLYPEDTNTSLRIDISTQTGAQIGEIDYVNIDKWNNAFIDSVLRLIISGIFS